MRTSGNIWVSSEHHISHGFQRRVKTKGNNLINCVILDMGSQSALPKSPWNNCNVSYATN